MGRANLHYGPRRKTALIAAAFVIVAAVLLALPFGPLFPISPWKPGYRQYAGARVDVFCPSSAKLPDAYRALDEIVAGAERFHGLRAEHRIAVVLCRSWGDCERFMPMLLRRHGIGAVTVPTGTVVYVTPRLDEKGLDHGEFLRHEISHCVLHQNQSPYEAWRLSKVEWLTEGLAVSYARQKTYISSAQFLERARREDLAPWIDPALRRPGFDIRTAYVVWRHFVEYLRASAGEVRFKNYLLASMAHPDGWREEFARAFQRGFRAAIADFQAGISGRTSRSRARSRACKPRRSRLHRG